MATKRTYGSSAEIQNFLIENIAPNYFDFENTNNYRSGLFGYINEVISVITMDTHNAINIARREFYPVSAQNPRSFYKMAAVQQIGLPTVTPARCNAVLLLDRDEILENSKLSNGVYTCVIDSTVQIMADNIPFSLLYPIVIISSETNGTWTHTTHYDKSVSNDLDIDPANNNYIVNRTINRDGKRYLMLSVILYQCARNPKSEMVTTDTSVETVSIQYKFEGDLANFEVFYIEEPEESTPVQLKKLMEGQAMVQSPFCYYKLINSNQLEISFPKNIFFNPEMNSEIRVDFYTSLGKKGEFPNFKGELACSMDSEDYPYNNNMTMFGVINGAARFAENIPSLDEYKEKVKAAYATNKTITSDNDLQHLFDERSGSNNKIVFKKKRADAFDRTYGAYILLKDSASNVVPTNTMTVSLSLNQFDSYNDATTKAVIRPGTLFEYEVSEDGIEVYTGKKVEDLVLTDDLSSYDESTDRFVYTNPFLIMCTLNPNLVGYYINSMEESKTVEYTYMNDNSIIQFIGNNFKIERNAIKGEDFYRISMQISPTQDLNQEDIVTVPKVENSDYYIRATRDGIVKEVVYDEEVGTVVANILYDDNTTDQIQIGSFVNQEPGDEDDTEESEEEGTSYEDDDSEEEAVSIDDGFYYHTGYTLNVKVYDHFVEGDVLATKKVTDHGRIRAGIEIENLLYDNGLYIPMVIEEYDESTNIYTLAGYISTDDILDSDDHLLIRNGIHVLNGGENEDISLPYKNLKFNVSVFYKNNTSNLTHKYANFDYFHSHTLTNTYKENSEDGISLIQFIQYIRSTLTFSQPDPDEEAGETETDVTLPDEESEEDLDESLIIAIKEMPLTKANWLKSEDNFSYMINSMSENYELLQEMFYDLENNYGFDLKFYNTYGKSKFFKVGLRDSWSALSRVNCSFNFGVYLSAVTSESTFLEKFRAYIKDLVESINSMNQAQQSIYIFSMINQIQKAFPEIGYMEYYGFNDFNESVQKIEPIGKSEMSDEMLTSYIPEFINIASHISNGEIIPNIDVTFLNAHED